MSGIKRAFTVTGLFFWLALCSVYCGSNASLRTMYVEELCYGTFSTTLSLRFQTSAILASVPNEPLDCELTLQTVRDSSIVIAFSRYSLAPSDSLVFRDRHNFQLSLSGGGNFLDERKSIIFEGPLRIRFITNDTYGPNRLKFQITYTQVHDGPCELDEYKCRNNKCIPSNLACDKHNHCGDIDDQGNCSPKGDFKDEVLIHKETRFTPSIAIIVAIVALAILVIVIVALLIRICVVKRKQTQQPQLPTVATASDVQQETPPSVFGRLRESFKVRRQPTAPPLEAAPAPEHTSENYEVPSMYPNLPTATDNAGIDNPEFKAEE